MANENQGRVSARPVVKMVRGYIEREGNSPTNQEVYDHLTLEGGDVGYHHEEAVNSTKKAIDDGLVVEKLVAGKKILDIPGRQPNPARPLQANLEEDENPMKDTVKKLIGKVPSAMKRLVGEHPDGVPSFPLKEALGVIDITAADWKAVVEGSDEEYNDFSYSGERSARRFFWATEGEGGDEDEARRKDNADYTKELFEDRHVESGISKDDLVKYVTKDQKMDDEDATTVVDDAISEDAICVVDDKVYLSGDEPKEKPESTTSGVDQGAFGVLQLSDGSLQVFNAGREMDFLAKEDGGVQYDKPGKVEHTDVELHFRKVRIVNSTPIIFENGYGVALVDGTLRVIKDPEGDEEG